MRRLLASIALCSATLAVPLAVACSSSAGSATSGVDEALPESQEMPVINGQRDTGHPAVLSMLMERAPTDGGTSEYSSCTGTIIKTIPAKKIGYVLTAAHCVYGATNIYFTQGNDNAAASGLLRYAMLDFTAHPQYDPSQISPYDIAVVRILGVNASTPVIPTLNPDTLALNNRVTSVGFGRTIRPNAPPSDAGPNTFKNRIDGSITRLTAAQIGVTYDNDGDICQGDSGGPVLLTKNNKEYVVGVHSFVTGPCVGVGYSVRATVHADFVNGILNAAIPAETCQTCRKTVGSGTETCARARETCLNDPQCAGLRKCISACGAAAIDAGSDAGPSEDCRKACSLEFPFGAGPYNTLIVFCSCKECTTTCSADDACKGLPKCGMKYGTAVTDGGPDACNTCLESSCCGAESACGADGHCYRCTKNPETAGCGTDPLYKAFEQCRATNCASVCAPPDAGSL